MLRLLYISKGNDREITLHQVIASAGSVEVFQAGKHYLLWSYDVLSDRRTWQSDDLSVWLLRSIDRWCI